MPAADTGYFPTREAAEIAMQQTAKRRRWRAAGTCEQRIGNASGATRMMIFIGPTKLNRDRDGYVVAQLAIPGVRELPPDLPFR